MKKEQLINEEVSKSFYKGHVAIAILLSIFWIVVAWNIADRHRQQEAQKEIISAAEEANILSQGIALDLRSLMSAKKGLAITIAKTPNVRQFVLSKCEQTTSFGQKTIHPAPKEDSINTYLTTVAQNVGLNALYLGNARGYGIASAHAESQASSVGHDYSDRSYFHQAREGHVGYQYSLGKYTGIGGIYFAAPVMDSDRFCGFVVLNIDTPALSIWHNQADAFLADENGVVIASKDKGLELKALPEAVIDKVNPNDALLRYGKNEFDRIKITPIPDKRYPGLKLLNGKPIPSLIHSTSISEYGFTLTVMQPVDRLQKIDGQRNIYFIWSVVIGILLIAIATSTLIYVKCIRLSHSRFRQIAERLEAGASAGIVGIWDWDILRNKLVWDRVMHKLYGIIEGDFGGTYEAWSRTIHPDDKAHTKGEINAALRGEREFAPEFRVIWPDGSIHYLKAVSHTTFDEHWKPLRMVGVNYDITEQKRIQQEMDKLAYYDRLTKLPNRRLLEDRLSQAIARAQREAQKISLLVIDLAKFKPVNDEFGHEAGDWLLQHVAARMLKYLRGSDTASRVGGDEFVILLPGVGSVEYAVNIAEKIRMALNEPFVTEEGKHLNISSSIGVVMYPDHAETARDLMRLGDEAMYRAKNGGRNAVKVFSPENTHYLSWKTAYNCGEPSIDREHKELIELSNAVLDLAMQDDVKPEQIDDAFDVLITHLANHFSHEEKILRTRNYEDLEEHSEKHQALLEEVRKLKKQCHEKGIPLGKLVVFLASEVVAGHMLNDDVKFYGLFSDVEQPK